MSSKIIPASIVVAVRATIGNRTTGIQIRCSEPLQFDMSFLKIFSGQSLYPQISHISDSARQVVIEQLLAVVSQQGNKLEMMEKENKLFMEKIDELQKQRDNSMSNEGLYKMQNM